MQDRRGKLADLILDIYLQMYITKMMKFRCACFTILLIILGSSKFDFCPRSDICTTTSNNDNGSNNSHNWGPGCSVTRGRVYPEGLNFFWDGAVCAISYPTLDLNFKKIPNSEIGVSLNFAQVAGVEAQVEVEL